MTSLRLPWAIPGRSRQLVDFASCDGRLGRVWREICEQPTRPSQRLSRESAVGSDEKNRPTPVGIGLRDIHEIPVLCFDWKSIERRERAPKRRAAFVRLPSLKLQSSQRSQRRGERDRVLSPRHRAAAFLGAPGPTRELRDSRLLRRVADRMRRRVRPESLISSSLFGLVRHGAIAALYLGLVYAAKVLFGVSITLNAVR